MIEQLKVVELASVLAGPAVGMFFVELGAEVLKIENKRSGGDVTRQWRIKGEKSDQQSSYFSSVNWKKKHVFLDFKSPNELKEVYQYIREADIVLSNLKPESAKQYGLDTESISTLNPKIISGTIAGFKSLPNRTAYDVVIQAETGYMSINGERESQPLKMPLAFMDLLAAHQLKEGILVALLKQQKTGKGYHVSVDLETAGIGSLANQASNWLMTGKVPQAIGSQHPNIAPYGDLFLCKDGGYVVLAVGADHQFRKLTEVLNLEFDETFATNKQRVQNRSALIHYLKQAIENREREDFLNQCIELEIPVGGVRSIDEVFEKGIGASMILEEQHENQISKRVKTVTFEVKELP